MNPEHVEILLIVALGLFVVLMLVRLLIISNFGITGNRKKYLGTGAAIKSAIIRFDAVQDRSRNPYYNYFAAALKDDPTGQRVFPLAGNPKSFIVPIANKSGKTPQIIILPSVLKTALGKTQDRIHNKTLTAANAAIDYDDIISDPQMQALALADLTALEGVPGGFALSDTKPPAEQLCCTVQGRCPANSVAC